jgi:hypothetical protein
VELHVVTVRLIIPAPNLMGVEGKGFDDDV